MYQIRSKNIYACPEEKFHKILWIKLIRKYKTIKTVSYKFHLSLRQLYKWKENKNNYPLKSLMKLSEDVGQKTIIKYIKTIKNSGVIINPKFDFIDNLELVEFLSHLLHDGGIDKQFRLHYTTHSKKLADRFNFLVNKCFGNTKPYIKKEKNKVTFYYTSVLGYIVNDVFGILKGSKVKNDVRIPKLVMNTNYKNKWRYLITAYVCDGIKSKAAIISSSRSIEKPSNLLKNLYTICNDIGLKSVVIKKSHEYSLKDGSRHCGWILRILDKKEKEIFFKNYYDYKSCFYS